MGRGARRGFTLVEVLVAALVLALGLLSIFGLAQTGAVESFQDEYRLLAVLRARRLVQAYLALDPAARRALEGKGPKGGLGSPFPPGSDAAPLPETYRARVSFFEESLAVEEAGDPGLRLLKVVVSWKFPGSEMGGLRTYTLKRLITDEDLTLREQDALEKK